MIYSQKKKSVFLLDGNCARRQKKKKKKLYRRKPVAQVLILPLSFEIESQPHACTHAYLPIYVFTRCSLYPFTFSITRSLYVAGPGEMWGTGER